MYIFALLLMQSNMNLEQVGDLSKDINNKVLKLIDIKIENDMEKVLAKFDSVTSEFRRLEDKQDAKFSAMDSKFNMIIWVMGILMAVMIALKFIR